MRFRLRTCAEEPRASTRLGRFVAAARLVFVALAQKRGSWLSRLGARFDRLGRLRILGGACLVLLAWAASAAKGGALDDTRSGLASASMSSGLPWDGHLLRGVKVRLSTILRPVASYARGGNFYGTAELVSMLERGARTVAARFPGSTLALGELSAAHGGKLSGHHSHRSGRDVDIAFFMHDAQGRSSRLSRFIQFGGAGSALNARQPLHFDDAKNWALVSSLLRDPEGRVQYVFVSRPLATRLLMEGRRRGESDAFLRAAAAVLVQPEVGHKHDNHFHVRIYCARDDRPSCRDSGPYWPWYDGAPPSGQYAELPLIRWHGASAAASATLSRQTDSGARAL